MEPLAGYGRQVHLDFHTSPHIDDVATEFDARAFAETFRRAHVNSVTLFAKCHHGMCYYPARTGTVHPALAGRDLLGEQIEALKSAGIRCPIYFTVGWEEDAAYAHPDWRQLRDDGQCARLTHDGATQLAGGWWYMNLLHPEYLDYMEAQVREILERYPVDGLFFDIVAFGWRSCWSAPSRAFREKHGLLSDDELTQQRFQMLGQAAFAARFSALLRGRFPHATLFFNSLHQHQRPTHSSRVTAETYSHYEIESLPSGSWGYHHFPKMARWVMTLGKPWLGMTGRFQKMWGDFGGIKPQAALEYECFRAQALGGALSIGDQLPPRGALEPAAYELIGKVYAECARAEEFYAGSRAFARVGVVLPEGAQAELSVEGALLALEELHYDAIVLDALGDFAGCELLVLPDAVPVTGALSEAVAAFRQRGGKLLISHESAFDDECRAAHGLALRRAARSEVFPTYWRAAPGFAPELAGSDRVFYSAGLDVAHDGADVLIERVLPYFQRTEQRFCSHRHAPPLRDACACPAALGGPDFAYFADPIFAEYRQAGNLAVRQALQAALERLIGPASFGAELSPSIQIVPRRRAADLLLTLLHYIPSRKAIDVDVVDQPLGFAGEVLRLPAQARRVRVFGGPELARSAGDGAGFELPQAKGRLLLEVPAYFG